MTRPPQKEASLLSILWHVALLIGSAITFVVSGYMLLAAVVNRLLCH